jgi:hypothetical protein
MIQDILNFAKGASFNETIVACALIIGACYLIGKLLD